MTIKRHSEQVRAEDESVAYPFKASTVSEESHKSIPSPGGTRRTNELESCVIQGLSNLM
ncbi:MAG: hypothetical protein NC191_06920 [Muribaculaceae bacterium]|nr:hypothetical protein [Muribaculaceae bacterium]